MIKPHSRFGESLTPNLQDAQSSSHVDINIDRIDISHTEHELSRVERTKKFKKASLHLIETLLSVSSLAQSGHNAWQVAQDALREPTAISVEASSDTLATIEQQRADSTLEKLDSLAGIVSEQQAQAHAIYRVDSEDGISTSVVIKS